MDKAIAIFERESAAARAKERLIAAGMRPERIAVRVAQASDALAPPVARSGMCVMTVSTHSPSDVRHVEALLRLEGGRVVTPP